MSVFLQKDNPRLKHLCQSNSCKAGGGNGTARPALNTVKCKRILLCSVLQHDTHLTSISRSGKKEDAGAVFGEYALQLLLRCSEFFSEAQKVKQNDGVRPLWLLCQLFCSGHQQRFSLSASKPCLPKIYRCSAVKSSRRISALSLIQSSAEVASSV